MSNEATVFIEPPGNLHDYSIYAITVVGVRFARVTNVAGEFEVDTKTNILWLLAESEIEAQAEAELHSMTRELHESGFATTIEVDCMDDDWMNAAARILIARAEQT